MPYKKNILVCPLDWGLGHATRCVPVIRKLIDFGANVIIGADGRSLAFLRKEFPELQFIKIPGYDIRYPENGSMMIKMLFSIPRILLKIKKEHKVVEKIIKEYHIDIVISDNRYGLWSKSTKCIFITHQISIQVPKSLRMFKTRLFKINKHFIDKFSECWMPDLKGGLNLSGQLSDNYSLFNNVFFVGLLSRFDNNSNIIINNENIIYDLLFIISGPEPQRTVFEDLVVEQIKNANSLKILIVRGITESDEVKHISENISMVNNMGTEELRKTIQSSSLIISRPGYSSIMDMVTLGKNAVFVPTPGQTEQIYLAYHLKKKGAFYFVSQKKINISLAIDNSKYYHGIINKIITDPLEERIKLLLS
ncbi:MAG: glycosyltransferase family protein [Bacteroidales bacterium]